jgi:hypothetical protein
MIAIFGPETARLFRLMMEISDLSPEDVEEVAKAWRRTSAEDRASAWAAIQHSAGPEERAAIQHAALVTRQQAMAVPQGRGRRDWAFWSAAWDAGGALAAAGEGAPDERARRLLVSAMATRLTWLNRRRPAPEVPSQRRTVEEGAVDEPARYPRRGGRR